MSQSHSICPPSTFQHHSWSICSLLCLYISLWFSMHMTLSQMRFSYAHWCKCASKFTFRSESGACSRHSHSFWSKGAHWSLFIALSIAGVNINVEWDAQWLGIACSRHKCCWCCCLPFPPSQGFEDASYLFMFYLPVAGSGSAQISGKRVHNL